MKKIVTSLLLFLVFFTTSFSTSIAPIYFNKRIDGAGGYQEYKISNSTLATMRYKVQVIPETKDEKMMEEMDKWVEVYPKFLIIPPKSTKTVKVLIKTKGNPKPAEYAFDLMLNPVVIPTLKDEESESKLAVLSGQKVGISFALVLNGYVGNLGNISKDLEITKIKSAEGLGIKIKNALKREVALDIIVTTEKSRHRDLIKIKSGEELKKIYPQAESLEIKEAPTGIELKKI